MNSLAIAILLPLFITLISSYQDVKAEFVISVSILSVYPAWEEASDPTDLSQSFKRDKFTSYS